MKRNKLIILLILEAGVVILFCGLLGLPVMFAGTLAMPFLPLAQGLDALASAGTLGAGLAAALWLGISAVPAALALRRGEKRVPERIALCFLSVVLALGLYGMARPFDILPEVLQHPYAVEVLQGGLGAAIWSAVIAWAVTCLIRRFRIGGWDGLLRSAGVLVLAACVLLTASAALPIGEEVMKLVKVGSESMEAAAAREWYSETLSTSSGTAWMELLVNLLLTLSRVLPQILTVAVLLRGMELLEALRTGASERLVPAAEGLSRSCCRALCITVALTTVCNLIQVILARFLTNLSFRAEIPVLSLVLTVLLLLFARLVIENKKLRDDNSLFI